MRSDDPPGAADPALAAWQIDLSDFPGTSDPGALLSFLVRYAVLAPSSRNTQPWRWVRRGDQLDLRADRHRRLPVVDPDDRELVISCGAALGTLEVAAARFGVRVAVATLPDPDDDPDLLASLTVRGSHAVTLDDDRLFSAITQRRTSRAPFDPLPLTHEVLDALVRAASRNGTWLVTVDDVLGKSLLADLVAEADRRQLGDRAFRDELASCAHGPGDAAGEGVRGDGFGLGRRDRLLSNGRRKSARDQRMAAESPTLAVLGTWGDTRADWLRAGQSLALVLLEARSANVWAGFLNQPVEVASLRSALAVSVGAPGVPQLLLRLGQGVAPPPEPRRPLLDALHEVAPR